ncbi:hypothetical protein DOTSEDRAFT_62512 [Dothistroma septosporum NZE10]|uniref:NAD(P)-binding domain-containing protein n=1 Tax=Dothistroma septosporum (strain NZE10 / CBS 128990) TaxID=675120 RepID=N1PKV0_DOTSN|nr:hypothetical protein DOTSEDRAFT_62512 [Dothistroma septosporum NZE10]
MESSSKSLFLIGPGFIGGEIIDRLLEDNYTVTTLVRREAAARDLTQRGFKTILGTLSDTSLISTQTTQHSITIHCATADDLPQSKPQTTYIHTSGCSYLSDDSQGHLASSTIPTIARFAMKYGYVGYVGGGQGVWAMVHTRDLSRGYLTMLSWLQDSGSEVALEHPYFFCDNGEEDPKPKDVPREEWGDLFGEYSGVVVGSNARNRAESLRELGWRPEYLSVKRSFLDDESPILLRESTEDFKGYTGVAASGAGE